MAVSIDPNRAYSLGEASVVLEMSPTSLRILIDADQLEAVDDGAGSVVIPGRALREFSRDPLPRWRRVVRFVGDFLDPF